MVRSVRSMSPVRTYQPGSISFEFNRDPVSPELSIIGAVDEVELMNRKERSNSNEMI